MTKPKICVILNAASGKKKHAPATTALIDTIRNDPRADLTLLDHPRDLGRVVRDTVAAGYTTIVAAGGDGTICGVSAELVDTGVALGVLPMGTFNFFARGLGIPDNPADALETAFEGQIVSVPVGDVNGKIFLNNASLGAYATVLDVREGVYKQWGRSRIAAYWSVIKAMLTLYNPLKLTITVDGKAMHVRSPMAFVASSAYQLEQYDFDGADAVRQGQLALILAPDNNRVQLLWRAAKILLGGIHRGEDYLMYTGHKITISARKKRRLVARDGENAQMVGPYHFKMRAAALQVRVPDRAAKETI
ncbi:diacylglycerol/lipid kinase family protein [Loktanella sp. R86503]|uniref:diacylglycerol/lipid kinase family protein n=1 Tax=Loktanella sp. R86503 TaxID=3093847 RepID=UPI0036DC3B70